MLRRSRRDAHGLRLALIPIALAALLLALAACGSEDSVEQIRDGASESAGEMGGGTGGGEDSGDGETGNGGGSGGGGGDDTGGGDSGGGSGGNSGGGGGGGNDSGGGSSGGGDGGGGDSGGGTDGGSTVIVTNGGEEEDSIDAWVWAVIAIGGLALVILIFVLGRSSKGSTRSDVRTPTERQQILASAISGWTAHGWVVEYETTDMATLRNGPERRQVNVDEYGRVSQMQLPPAAGGGPSGSSAPPA